jgi:type 1 glutamine amidotransferase
MRCFLPPSLFFAALALLSHFAVAAEPRRVVVCTVTAGFRHSSIPDAEKTLQKLADTSKAFIIMEFVQQPKVDVPKKPAPPRALKPDADDKARARFEQETKRYEAALAQWTPENEAAMKAAQAEFDRQMRAKLASLAPASLVERRIDAVIFANTTGDLPLPDAEGLAKWVADGHAFIGMHSASDTLKEFAPYYEMLQGTFDGHGAQVPADLVAADTSHPANAGIGATWDIPQEEMYLIRNHDRTKLRTLWFLRHHPNDPAAKGHFPVSWCRMAGQGRVFYTSLGHREDLWSDDPALKDRKNPPEVSRQYQAHILGGIQWALGLAEGSATPNPDAN